MLGLTVSSGTIAALMGALTLAGCVVDGPYEREVSQRVDTSFDDGYDKNTPCGTAGGPSCLVGWCMNTDGCAPGFVRACDALFAATTCAPAFAPPPPTPDTCTVALGELHTFAPEGGSLGTAAVVNPGATDMTGWLDPLGDTGEVKIETADGSLNAKYTVETTRDELAIKITGGGFAVNFDPNDPLVIRVYNACGKQQYATTGTVRVLGGKRVTLKAGPQDVRVTRTTNGVVTLERGGKTITMTPSGSGSGATLEGDGVQIAFDQRS